MCGQVGWEVGGGGHRAVAQALLMKSQLHGCKAQVKAKATDSYLGVPVNAVLAARGRATRAERLAANPSPTRTSPLKLRLRAEAEQHGVHDATTYIC